MFKITKKRTIIILAVLAVLGALTAFYGTNLVLCSIVQKDIPFLDFFKTLSTSFDFLIVSVDMVLFIFFFLRLYLHPTHEQRMLLVYGIVLASLSLLGLIFNTLSGIFVYGGSFIDSHPFAGFHIIMYIYHALMLALGFVMIFYFRKKVINDDIIIHKTTVGYVFYTILWSLIYFIALNRLGAFLLFPAYLQWSSITLIYPAYVALLLPTVILFNDLIYIFGGYKKSPAAGIAVSSVVAFCAIFCFGQIIVRGRADPLFIQLVSPINPIGRLLTFPYDTVLQMLVAGGLGIYTLFNSIRFKRASDFNKLPYEIRKAKMEGRQANFANPGRKSKADKLHPLKISIRLRNLRKKK